MWDLSSAMDVTDDRDRDVHVLEHGHSRKARGAVQHQVHHLFTALAFCRHESVTAVSGTIRSLRQYYYRFVFAAVG